MNCNINFIALKYILFGEAPNNLELPKGRH